MTDRPTWPAYVLTLLAAGLGHCYLGRWRRGGAWFSLYVLAVAVLSARSLSGAFDPESPFFVTALQFEAVSYANVAVPLAVLFVAVLDVYLLALADDHGSGS